MSSRAEINTLERQGQQPSSGKGKRPCTAAGCGRYSSESVIGQPPPGAVPIEGEITEGKNEVSVYGFAMLDSGYNFGQNKSELVRYRAVLPNYRPSPTSTRRVEVFLAGVRQSRFGVKSSTTTPHGDLNTIFEFELFGTGVDAGQTTFRLRHAYGQLGAIGAGQTWSPYMDIDVFPNTIEYWGPDGMVFFRNVQLRWMPVRKKGGSVTIALEKPGRRQR